MGLVAGQAGDADADMRVEIGLDPLDIGEIYAWLTRPDCGAVIIFSGTVRDSSGDRTGVRSLTYEAYEAPALQRLRQIGEQIFERFPQVRRVALLHRLGTMELGESTVVVGVASEHRPDAFDGARYGIDTLKESVPIWKKEVWAEGIDWGLGALPLREIDGA